MGTYQVENFEIENKQLKHAHNNFCVEIMNSKRQENWRNLVTRYNIAVVVWRKRGFKECYIPANFFWDVGVRFLSWECWDFWKRHDHFRRFPKKSEVFRRRPKSAEDVRSLPKAKLSRKRLSTKSEIARKVLSFIHFTHGFRSFHGSELTYFWKLCPARRQQLTFFNQAWEIGPQAWAGVRSKFSTRRRESWQV